MAATLQDVNPQKSDFYGVLRTKRNISGGKWRFVTTQVRLMLLFKEQGGNFVHWNIFGANLKETKIDGRHWENTSVPRDRTRGIPRHNWSLVYLATLNHLQSQFKVKMLGGYEL